MRFPPYIFAPAEEVDLSSSRVLINRFVLPLATNHTQCLQLQPWEDTPHPCRRSHETRSDSASLLPASAALSLRRESSFLLHPQNSFLVILDFSSNICSHHLFLSSDVRHVIPLENWAWIWGGCIPLVRRPEGFKVSLYQWCPPGSVHLPTEGPTSFSILNRKNNYL